MQIAMLLPNSLKAEQQTGGAGARRLQHFGHFGDSEPGFELVGGVAGDELAEGFFGVGTVGLVGVDEAFDGVFDVVGGDFFEGEGGEVLIGTEGAAEEDVVGFGAADAAEVADDAHEADVGDLVLAAGVGAAGDGDEDGGIDLAFFFEEFEDAGGALLGFDDGEVAELGAGAGDEVGAPERGVWGKAGGGEFAHEGVDFFYRDVGEDEVLFIAEADLGAVVLAVFFGEVGKKGHLIGGYASAFDGGADVVEAGLFLGAGAHVVGVGSGGRADDGVIVFESKAEVGFEGIAEFLPAPVGDEEFEAGAGAFFAVAVVAEDVGDAAGDGGELILADEDAESLGEEGGGGEAAADHDAVAGFFESGGGIFAFDSEDADVVDLGLVAVEVATGDGGFEFAGEVGEFFAAVEEHLVDGVDGGCGVDDFGGE